MQRTKIGIEYDPYWNITQGIEQERLWGGLSSNADWLRDVVEGMGCKTITIGLWVDMQDPQHFLGVKYELEFEYLTNTAFQIVRIQVSEFGWRFYLGEDMRGTWRLPEHSDGTLYTNWEAHKIFIKKALTDFYASAAVVAESVYRQYVEEAKRISKERSFKAVLRSTKYTSD